MKGKEEVNIRKKKFRFLSKDGKTTIYAVQWIPKNRPVRAVLQIVHGMVEYIDRYDEFARYMARRGFLVAGHDHLGHGDSVRSEAEWGYFASKNPSKTVVEDMYQLTCMMQQEYPDKPYFILGHSMGSYLLRRYLTVHSRAVTGAVVCATGGTLRIAARFALLLCRTLELFFGGYHRSKFVTGLCFGRSYQKFAKDPADATKSWLSKNIESVQEYSRDRRSGFVFTLNGYNGLFSTVSYDNQMRHIRKIRKDLPVLFIAGKDDPVGSFGRGVKRAYRQYRLAGIRDVKLKLYPGDRHEILQETDRARVFADVYRWCVKHI